MSEIRVDKLKGEDGSSTVEFTTGAVIPSGKTISGAGDISITGTLTYEDVTNVDSLGIVTARGGLEVGTSGAGGTISLSSDGNTVAIGSHHNGGNGVAAVLHTNERTPRAQRTP